MVKETRALLRFPDGRLERAEPDTPAGQWRDVGARFHVGGFVTLP